MEIYSDIRNRTNLANRDTKQQNNLIATRVISILYFRSIPILTILV
jgi:hypothetical protein